MRTNLRADAEANRTRLVEAARTAIRSHGLDVDVRMITSIADVGLGTFYRNFANKEELLNILIEEIASEFDSLLEDALRINDPAEAFEDFLDAFWAFGNRHGHSHDLRQRIGAESEARNSWVKVEKLIERAKDADLIDRSFATSFVEIGRAHV